MPPTPLAERVRERLLALFADDRPDPERALARLKELRTLEDVPTFSAAVSLLVHLDLPEPEAEKLMGDILRHRTAMRRALERDPGLRVAAADFLSNVEHRLTNPKFIELSLFEDTGRSAVTDPLTGLYNRRFFDAAMEREVRRSRRYGLSFCLLMLDLDHFKRINDASGHLFGDVVLQRVAGIVRRSTREADMAYRFGGEEFSVILPETDRLGARAVAERIRTRVEESFAEAVRGREIAMTVSGGISCYPEDGQSADTLVARAEEALTLAKGSGRNRVSLRHTERRSSARHPVNPRVRTRLGGTGGGPARPALALNLSRCGILVEAEGNGPPDAVSVFFDDGSIDPGGFEIPGRVVRVEQGHGSNGQDRVGIAFDLPVPEECPGRQVIGEKRMAEGAEDAEGER